MSDNWVTLATFDTMVDVFLAQSILEENDIPSIVENQHMATMYSPPIGGASLKIERANFERAREILEG